MILVHDPMERLRPLVGFKGWDYCVLWKLTQNQRYIEWMGCCCGGADQNPQLEELQFPVIPCRDSIFQHPPTLSCQLLSHLPSSILLDSGIHAQALVSNTPKWLNFSTSSESSASSTARDTIGTRTVIPVAGGLVELFVAKQVGEDQSVVEFVTTQCNFLLVDQEAAMMNPMTNDGNINTSISISTSVNDVVGDEQYEHQTNSFLASDNGHFHPEAALMDPNPVLPFDLSVDRIRLCNSPMNFFQFGEETKSRIDDGDDDQLFEGGDHDHDHDHDHQMINEEQGNIGNGANQEDELKDQFGRENANGRMGSTSDCSDQVDDQEEEYGKCNRKKGGKGQAKNLQAERRRRKKLNERLYMLRTLVPNITKLDKASILGDAISFVKDLKQQEKELQDELAEPSDGEGVTEANQLHGPNSTQDTSISQNGGDHFGSRPAFGFPGVPNNGSTAYKMSSTHESEAANEKGQQMEPQVEVAQIDGNKFFVKVFCEFKAGGFVRLMEALNSLGFVVTNANVTRVLSLVSNVFQVEKKDTSELVQAEYVRESLLELTRGSRGWHDQTAKASESCSNLEYSQHHHHHLHDPHVHVNSHFQHHHHHPS